ncbi:aminotransferase class I/II-fold pyridoxal phosphate-dependent enzyme [Ruminiclostridium josui]|uniref:aminotransferase class I/II-fold pyridoxal phosphate-dependent enzyme n=1 Tax=Ruminiclostridium josui TaxID=1499 RepID=UPI0004664485|nr:aminotransferase class I/II-fold pyridoxal phosphate-dependent enzyme [Ruminiclostridium josui]
MSTPNIAGLSLEEKRELAKKLLNSKGNLKNNTQTEKKTDEKVILSEYYNFDEFPEYKELFQRNKNIESLNIRNQFFDTHNDVNDNVIEIDNKEYINYSGYNYLGFSGAADINEFTKKAIDKYGTSASASRIVSGDLDLHRELEKEIADIIGTEECVVSVSGYGTNLSTIGYLIRPSKDVIFYDALCHNSIMAGAVKSGARRIPFAHNDVSDLERLLNENRNSYERALIIVEGVYSMDGDIVKLPEILNLKNKYKALLMIDEAHSMGVIGKNGFGVREYFDIKGSDVDIWMGTLSKSFASCGGYIAGSKSLIEMLKNFAPGLIMYSAGLTPTNASAALAAIRKMRKEPECVTRLIENSKLFLRLAKEKGLETGLCENTPIVPVLIKNSIQCIILANNLFEKGINVHPIMYPAVPEGDSRLRFFITAKHTEEQIRYTVDTIAEELKKIRDKF